MTAAETILYGGTVRTMDPHASSADAVAVAQGRIVAIGDEQAADWRGPHTTLIDLHGRTVLPGFQDAHIHPTAGGLNRLRCDLGEIHGRREYLDAVGEYGRANPNLEWVLGAGWYGDVFDGGFPDRSLLDELEPHRPVVLTSHDNHGVWVNSAALRRAGITSRTPDPAGGRIHRDHHGQPTGMLTEGAANLVTDLLAPVAQSDIEAALLNTQTYLHSLGITAWQDAALGDAIGIPDAYEAYCTLARQDRLSAKVTGALWWDRDTGADEQLAKLCRRRDTAPGHGFQATAVKIMQDGVCENLTGAMLQPYQNQAGECGLSFIDPDELARITRILDEQRFDVHIHAVGDRAVRESLDAASSTPGDWDSRHQLAHIDLIAEADIPRMAQHGVIANLQPLWARRDPVLVSTKLPYLTEQQQARHFVFGQLAAAGVPLAFSSDWPVSSPNPLWGAHVAVNRTAPPGDPHASDQQSQANPLLPDQAIGVHQALLGYTRGAARANRLETTTGSIELGKSADLTVLDQDPYRTPAREIGSLRVELTMASGTVVYTKP